MVETVFNRLIFSKANGTDVKYGCFGIFFFSFIIYLISVIFLMLACKVHEMYIIDRKKEGG